MLQSTPVHPLESNISKIIESWDHQATINNDEHLTSRQSIMPDVSLTSTWNTSHAVTRSPELRSLPSNGPSGCSSAQHCSCCSHDKGSSTVPIPAESVAPPTPPVRKAFLHSSTMVRRTTMQAPSPVEAPTYQSFQAVQLSPGLKLSPAESEVLWMLPTFHDDQHQTLVGQSENTSSGVGKKKVKIRERFRLLLSSSKESIKQTWYRGEKPDVWGS